MGAAIAASHPLQKMADFIFNDGGLSVVIPLETSNVLVPGYSLQKQHVLNLRHHLGNEAMP